MPSSSSLCAMSTLSSAEKLTASPCVPSRSVVSNVNTRITKRGQRTGDSGQKLLACRDTYLLLLFEKRHHTAQLFADFFNGLRLRRLAHGEEILAAGLVFADPSVREFAGLNFAEGVLHLFARLGADHARC